MADVSIKLRVSLQTTQPVVLPTRPPLWMIKEDREIFGKIRSCAPCPAVIVLKEDPHAIFNKQWQYFYRAINYNVPLRYIGPNYGTTLAFFNGTGFPGHHDWIGGADADQEDPRADKVRSCVRNVVTGVPVGNMLKIQTFDSRLLPPLKPGRSYPQRVEEIDIDIYEITPRTHRWMFVVENIVNKSGLVKPFDHGATYSWMGDNNYYTFLPLISNHSYGDVLYPLANLLPIGLDAPIPSPYRWQ
jgi:hypothetical protein